MDIVVSSPLGDRDMINGVRVDNPSPYPLSARYERVRITNTPELTTRFPRAAVIRGFFAMET